MRTALPLLCELEGYRVARGIMSNIQHYVFGTSLFLDSKIISRIENPRSPLLPPSPSLARSKENYRCASGSGDKAQRQFVAGRGKEGRKMCRRP